MPTKIIRAAATHTVVAALTVALITVAALTTTAPTHAEQKTEQPKQANQILSTASPVSVTPQPNTAEHPGQTFLTAPRHRSPSSSLPAKQTGQTLLTVPTAAYPHTYLLHNATATLTLYLAIAKTPAQRQQGLSGITHLPANAGMLFVFATPQKPCFWMKNTPIPLGIAFLSPTGKIIQTETMHPNTTTRHCPAAPTTQAIETHPHLLQTPAGISATKN